MMLGLGWSLAGLARRVHSRLPRMRSALVLGAGVLTLLFRLQMPAFAANLGGRTSSPGAVLPQSSECPCHGKRARPQPLPSGTATAEAG
jgi:hypothetical protein